MPWRIKALGRRRDDNDKTLQKRKQKPVKEILAEENNLLRLRPGLQIQLLPDFQKQSVGKMLPE